VASLRSAVYSIPETRRSNSRARNANHLPGAQQLPEPGPMRGPIDSRSARASARSNEWRSSIVGRQREPTPVIVPESGVGEPTATRLTGDVSVSACWRSCSQPHNLEPGRVGHVRIVRNRDNNQSL